MFSLCSITESSQTSNAPECWHVLRTEAGCSKQSVSGQKTRPYLHPCLLNTRFTSHGWLTTINEQIRNCFTTGYRSVWYQDAKPQCLENLQSISIRTAAAPPPLVDKFVIYV